jgi:hypothetical protein
MDTLVRNTILYGFEVWRPGLLESDWSSAERVQITLLRRIIRCKHTVPHPIVLAEFGALSSLFYPLATSTPQTSDHLADLFLFYSAPN